MATSSDWVLAALAALGLGISVYLFWTSLANAHVFCPLGTGCDIVQSSRFAKVFGIPVAALGLGFYGLVLGVGFWRTDVVTRWRLALPLASAGVAASIVFSATQIVAIHATCTLCLASALLTVLMLALVLRRAPSPGARRRIALATWTWSGTAAAAVVLILLGGYAASAPRSAAPSYAEGLARHLKDTGAVFYGAYWCPHCADQKRLFGAAARFLPYVECDPRGAGANPALCREKNIRAYPTWDIRGERIEGVVSLEDLAARSGYPPPPASR